MGTADAEMKESSAENQELSSIRFKVCCLCFKVVTGSVPVCLSKLLHVYTPSRILRSSSDTRLFAISCYKQNQHGFRSFARYALHT